jgi:hypothetical protein
MASGLRPRAGIAGDRVGEVGAEERRQALEELFGLERLDPAQHLLAAPFQPLAVAGAEAVQVLVDDAQARHLVERVGQERAEVGEQVQGVLGAFAVGAEQLRVPLADVRARVGPAEPVGEGCIEGREG